MYNNQQKLYTLEGATTVVPYLKAVEYDDEGPI